MSMNHTGREPAHDELQGLLPWYVNETLGAPDRVRLELHLRECATCRAELERERLIRERMAGDRAIAYLPAPSLNRLRAQLDELDRRASGGESPRPGAASSRGARSRRSPLPGLRLWAAGSAIAALGVVAAIWRNDTHPREPQGSYYTVTTPTNHPAGEVIRAVFSPTITLVELQAILDEAQLRIISGPTEAGVYSLAAVSTRPVVESLAMLRRHPSVRFAETTLLAAQPDHSPAPSPDSSHESSR